MSELFPKITSDEIDYEKELEDARREQELKGDKPPHHE